MVAKEKVTAFLTDYKQQISTLNVKISETACLLEDLSLEIQFIQEKEIPDSVQRRVLTGDRSQENKVRKQLQKLQVEYAEKSEDLIVIQKVLDRYKQQAADQAKQLERMFIEERNMVVYESYKRMNAARSVYIKALQDTDELNLYRDLERGLQEVEVAANRRRYVDTTFPIDQLKLNALSLNPQEVNTIVKGLK